MGFFIITSKVLLPLNVMLKKVILQLQLMVKSIIQFNYKAKSPDLSIEMKIEDC